MLLPGWTAKGAPVGEGSGVPVPGVGVAVSVGVGVSVGEGVIVGVGVSVGVSVHVGGQSDVGRVGDGRVAQRWRDGGPRLELDREEGIDDFDEPGVGEHSRQTRGGDQRRQEHEDGQAIRQESARPGTSARI